jgi:hypothetical protein
MSWVISGIALLTFSVVLLLSMRNWLPLPQVGFAQDLGILLETSWRFAQGQMPHRDYSSPIGPFYAVVIGYFAAEGGPDYEDFRIMPGILFFAASLTCFLICMFRVSVPLALLASIATGLVAGGTYHMGFAPEMLSFAVLFNRMGWTMVMLVTFAALLPDSNVPRPVMLAQYFFSGVLLACLLFLKVNFFAVAAIITVFGLIIPQQDRKANAIATFAGAVLASLTWLQSIDWRLDNIVRDLGYAASARSDNYTEVMLSLVVIKAISNSLPFVLLAGLVAILVLQEQVRVALVISVAVLGAIALILTNSCGNGGNDPLLWSLLLVCAVWVGLNTNEWPMRSQRLLSMLLLSVVGGAALAWLILPQFLSYAAWQGLSAQNLEPAAKSGLLGPVRTLLVGPHNNWGPHFSTLLREGSDLIEQNVEAEESVLYADFCNPFGFATNRRSPVGSMLWYDRIATFSSAKHPEAAVLFADADFLLVPKQPLSADGTSAFVEIYGDYVRGHYVPIQETQNFVLLGRRA